MPDWLLAALGILTTAGVGFGFNYYLQGRLFKIQSKEKSIDMLMDDLDSLRTLYSDSWGPNKPRSSKKFLHSSRNILHDQHRFLMLAKSVSEHFKLTDEIHSCLHKMIKSSNDDLNLSKDKDLQDALLKAFDEVRIALMKNRYR